MKTRFFELADHLFGTLHGDEVLLCSFSAERSDFVRFNRARVRQAGSVTQCYLSVRLIRQGRQASASITLAGDADDLDAAQREIARLRETLAQLPQDPWLLYADEPHSTSTERRGRLPDAHDVVGHATRAAEGLDFVGFYAAGTIYRGFANSLYQRNWHEVDTFNFDWSLHLEGDKAVKDSYAGFEWDGAVFDAKLNEGAQRLELLRAPSRTLSPGEYRTYLAPRALEEVTALLQWGAFSARMRATRQSALLRMQSNDGSPPGEIASPGESLAHVTQPIESFGHITQPRESFGHITHPIEPFGHITQPIEPFGKRLSPKVTLIENTEGGVAPAFQEDGFVKPPAVTLIAAGALGESLVSARSAREYGLQPNGANAGESPQSLDMAPGALQPGDVLTALDTGLYVSNLWYLNFSDRPAARMTGMTRFATLWVENGRIVAPVTPLRFDDTLYRMLGENLVDLTASRELMLSASTYDERSTSSAHLPGALLERLRFTL